MTSTVPDLQTVYVRLSLTLAVRPGSILSQHINSTEWRFLMETIRGKKSLEVDFDGWKERVANYKEIVLDLGTGDGRCARSFAQVHPDWFMIGVDACRENLREHSQAKLQNLLFVIASAQELPHELDGLISHVTVNFPWGTLLESLLADDPKLVNRLMAITRLKATLDLRLNGGALAEAGQTLEA